MSHTTAVGIKITNIDALRAALNSLNEQGIKCSLQENVAPRAYFPNQPGMGVAPFVVRVDSAKYDIGLYLQDDGSYEPRTDFWAGNVESVMGAAASSPEYEVQAKLGKLFQEYGVQAAMHEARMQGKSARRVQKEDGTVQVVLAGFN